MRVFRPHSRYVYIEREIEVASGEKCKRKRMTTRVRGRTNAQLARFGKFFGSSRRKAEGSQFIVKVNVCGKKTKLRFFALHSLHNAQREAIEVNLMPSLLVFHIERGLGIPIGAVKATFFLISPEFAVTANVRFPLLSAQMCQQNYAPRFHRLGNTSNDN